MNARLTIVARAESEAEVAHLLQRGADTVIAGEREIARGMIEHALARGAGTPGAGRVTRR